MGEQPESFVLLVSMADQFQYVAITRMASAALTRAAADRHRQAQYDEKSLAYRAQAALYHSKFWILGMGGVLLLIIFIGLFQ